MQRMCCRLLHSCIRIIDAMVFGLTVKGPVWRTRNEKRKKTSKIMAVWYSNDDTRTTKNGRAKRCIYYLLSEIKYLNLFFSSLSHCQARIYFNLRTACKLCNSIEKKKEFQGIAKKSASYMHFQFGFGFVFWVSLVSFAYSFCLLFARLRCSNNCCFFIAENR